MGWIRRNLDMIGLVVVSGLIAGFLGYVLNHVAKGSRLSSKARNYAAFMYGDKKPPCEDHEWEECRLDQGWSERRITHSQLQNFIDKCEGKK